MNYRLFLILLTDQAALDKSLFYPLNPLHLWLKIMLVFLPSLKKPYSVVSVPLWWKMFIRGDDPG